MEGLELKTVREAAEYLGVNERYFRRFIMHTGLVVVYQLTPRKTMVAKEDLDKYVKECKGYYSNEKKGG